MRDTLGESLKSINWIHTRKIRLSALLTVLSLVVCLNVFWFLRQPGLTLAGDATCGIQEHTHDDTCGTQTLSCTLPEEAHVHGEDCFETRFVEASETTQLTCTLTEDPHIHQEGCYETIWVEPTVETVCVCTSEEEGHTHDDSCYETVESGGGEERVLRCQLTSEPHSHLEGCFATEAIDAHEEQVLTCTLPEEAHVHGDDCYTREFSCELEEHVHSIECYSDVTADVETMLDWQQMFAGYPFTGDLRRDLVGIAKTQVGYAESSLNFETGDDGVRRGYTRYGAWYGTPYRDWSAMFVSFCLNYAGADPAEVPGNTGAAAMAAAWTNLGKYAPVGDYEPLDGDLVFFTDNTVGIVAEIHGSSFYVIRGDVEDAVQSDVLSLTDSTIKGWGCTVGTVPAEEATEPTETTEATEPTESTEATETTEPAEEDTSSQDVSDETLLDISNGPAVFLFVGGDIQQPMARFAMRSTRTTAKILSYLESRNGSYFFTLLDVNNHELPKDANGNYIVQADTGYKLTISFTSPEGFLPGVYEYQVPNGLMVDGGEGTFILKDGTNVGSWTVTNDGLITLDFNDHMNSRTDITISATLGIHFPLSEDPIDFDGKITVTVEKPPEDTVTTQVQKWGSQGNEDTAGKTDESRLFWTVYIIGTTDSHIVGSTLTDKLLQEDFLGTHRYTQTDMDAGISIGASEIDPATGVSVNWHSWKVLPGAEGLTWDENGWSYVIPETARCEWCGEITLGNNWEYYIDYSSTPIPSNATGALAYMNHVSIDRAEADGWAEFRHGDIPGTIHKTGAFLSDAAGGGFLWSFDVMIPGMREGQKAVYYWYIMDYMDIRNSSGSIISYITNDANNATVTATYDGTTYVVPHVQHAGEHDPFAWNNAWSPDYDGVYYGREIDILCRCHCTEENCQFWENGTCESEYWFEADNGQWYTNGYCQCWTLPGNTTFTFTYRTEDMSIVEHYGNLGNKIRNEAVLYSKVPMGNGVWSGSLIDNTQAFVDIPGMFQKSLTHDFDGYTANYEITINEAKIPLTNGTPLTIHDVMTETLAYISGSLVITAEDADGNVTTLQQGTDFTVSYDGTGNTKDENGKPVHILDIVILHPQPVMYTLDYDTALILPTEITEGIKYSNSATITLWGQDITDTSTEKVYADINISAKNYRVELFKTSGATGLPLAGATFGLFNEHGGLITTEVTGDQGELLFQTNIIEGIILREHVPYYMQELRAPPGYQLDDTKYWFCFCNNTGDSCATCDQILAGLDAVRIPDEQIGKIEILNDLKSYNLPGTGGPGTYPVILVSVVFIITPLVYWFIQGRKQERRGIG